MSANVGELATAQCDLSLCTCGILYFKMWKIKSYHLILNKKHLKVIWDSNLLSAQTNMFMHNFGRQFHVAESLN